MLRARPARSLGEHAGAPSIAAGSSGQRARRPRPGWPAPAPRVPISTSLSPLRPRRRPLPPPCPLRRTCPLAHPHRAQPDRQRGQRSSVARRCPPRRAGGARGDKRAGAPWPAPAVAKPEPAPVPHPSPPLAPPPPRPCRGTRPRARCPREEERRRTPGRQGRRRGARRACLSGVGATASAERGRTASYSDATPTVAMTRRPQPPSPDGAAPAARPAARAHARARARAQRPHRWQGAQPGDAPTRSSDGARYAAKSAATITNRPSRTAPVAAAKPARAASSAATASPPRRRAQVRILDAPRSPADAIRLLRRRSGFRRARAPQKPRWRDSSERPSHLLAGGAAASFDPLRPRADTIDTAAAVPAPALPRPRHAQITAQADGCVARAATAGSEKARAAVAARPVCRRAAAAATGGVLGNTGAVHVSGGGGEDRDRSAASRSAGSGPSRGTVRPAGDSLASLMSLPPPPPKSSKSVRFDLTP